VLRCQVQLIWFFCLRGFPDGIFSYQFGIILVGVGMENVGIFIDVWYYCDHLVYFMANM
jgi:hypothetical protein